MVFTKNRADSAQINLPALLRFHVQLGITLEEVDEYVTAPAPYLYRCKAVQFAEYRAKAKLSRNLPLSLAAARILDSSQLSERLGVRICLC